MSRPLYAIEDDLTRLNDLLEEIEGDLSRLGEMEPAITAWMDGLAGEEAHKLDGYVNLIRQLEMEMVAAKAESEQWAQKARSRENRARWLRDRLKQHLEQTGQAQIKTETGRVVAIQKNGGKPPVVVNEEAPIIDPRFIRTISEVDKEAVRKALEDGEVLTFARLGERGTSLRVK